MSALSAPRARKRRRLSGSARIAIALWLVVLLASAAIIGIAAIGPDAAGIRLDTLIKLASCVGAAVIAAIAAVLIGGGAIWPRRGR